MLFCCNCSLLNWEVKFCPGKASSVIIAQLTSWQKNQYGSLVKCSEQTKICPHFKKKLLVMTQPYNHV